MLLRRAVPAVFLLLAAALSGCEIYAASDDEPTACDVAVAPSQLVRDPLTGECNAQPQSPPCGPYLPLPHLSGGICGNACEWLDETACLAAPGCQAAYIDSCPGRQTCDPDRPRFAACWATDKAQYVPSDRRCDTLDAYACVSRDDCAPRYHPLENPPPGRPRMKFQDCATEPPPPLSDDSCERATCPTGYHCEQTCEIPPPIGCVDGAGNPTRCPDLCKAACVPGADDPGACDGTVLCQRAAPACPAATTAGIAGGCYTGYCIPLTECGHEPGRCYDEVVCRRAPPACPAGTEPGVADGCYTGYCIPVHACEPPLTCAQLDEQACLIRAECEPVYDGADCTCTPAGCTCARQVYARCVDDPPPP